MDSMVSETKYQTLANEYSKVTAKCTILKKAVLDEQARNADLKSVLTDTDRQLRQQRQEAEGLTFRNQQLLRRVELLQTDLVAVQSPARSKKKLERLKPAAAVHVTDTAVLQEELESKINENVRLNQLLNTVQLQHQDELGTLTSRLHRAESELDVVSRCSSSSAALPPSPVPLRSASVPTPPPQQPAACDQCTQLRQQLDGSLEQLREAGEEQADCSRQLEDVRRQLQRVQAASRYYAPLQDAARVECSRLNVPTVHRSESQRAGQLCGQLTACVAQLMGSMANYHTYSQQRLLLLSPHGLSTVNNKFSSLLLDQRFAVAPVTESLQRLTAAMSDPARIVCLSTLPELSAVRTALSTYRVYLDKTANYQRLSLQEEERYDTAGQQLMEQLSGVAIGFSRLHSTVSVLVSYVSESSKDLPPQSAVPRLFNLLASVLDSLCSSLRGLSDGYSCRVRDESTSGRLSGQLRVTEECIVSSLQMATSSSDKLWKLWDQRLPWLCEFSTVRLRAASTDCTVSPVVSRLLKRSAAYIRTVGLPESPRAALRCRAVAVGDETPAGDVVGRVRLLETTVTTLEQERERWKLDFSLLTAKYQELQQQSDDADPAVVSAVDPESSSATASTPPPSDGSTLGETHCTAWADAAAREQRLRDRTLQQLEDMVERMQTAQGRCRHFQTECYHATRSLDAAESRSAQLQLSSDEAAARHQQLREELVSTSANYETQMAAMSDHLATLNETLAAQRDQIDQLRYQLAQLARGAAK